MTHIIKLLYGDDKRNPTRELSLTDLDANIYLVLDGFSPGAGQQNVLYSGGSSRFDGQQFLGESRANTQVQIKYSLSGSNTAHLQAIQRKISRFMLDAMHGKEKVYLEYRWSVSGLDDLPRPVIGQLNHYLEIINADVKTWPQTLHSGAMIAGYVDGVAMDITGRPYWEGLEQRAGNADGLAETTDSTVKYTLDNSEITTTFSLAMWIKHKAADYAAFEYYVDGSNYILLRWNQSLSRFELSVVTGGASSTYSYTSVPVSAGEWHHLCVIAGATITSFYFNGSVRAGSLSSATYASGGDLTIGSSTSTAFDTYTTELDGVRLWDSDITAAEILALYTAESGIISAGDSIQYPLYFKSYEGGGTFVNPNPGYDLLGYWSMQEDTTADRADATWFENDLTPTGSIAAGTGKISNAADFELSDGRYMYNTPITDFRHSFSICAWVNAESSPGATDMVVFSGRSATYGGTSASSQFALYYDSSGGTPDFNWYVRDAAGSSSGGARVNESTISTISLATWYFVVCTYNASTGVVSISVNNNTADTDTQDTPGTYEPVTQFTVGGHGSLNVMWDGLIDEVSVWGHVLSSAEISTLYNSGSGAAPSIINKNYEYGILNGLPGDSLAKIRLEAELRVDTPARQIWAAIVSTDSTIDPTLTYYPIRKTSAAATSGSGSDTATIEGDFLTPSDFLPGRYQVLAHMQIVGASATTATVKPYYRIGATTSPEHYGTAVSVATNASYLFQNLGTIEIDWPMDTLSSMVFGLHIAETAAVVVTPAVDFVMLIPAEAVKTTSETSSITVVDADTLHIDERRTWVSLINSTGRQKYHFHFEGSALRGMPYKYNYLFYVMAEDNQTYYTTLADAEDLTTIRVYVTPRWGLPGGMVA